MSKQKWKRERPHISPHLICLDTYFASCCKVKQLFCISSHVIYRTMMSVTVDKLLKIWSSYSGSHPCSMFLFTQQLTTLFFCNNIFWAWSLPYCYSENCWLLAVSEETKLSLPNIKRQTIESLNLYFSDFFLCYLYFGRVFYFIIFTTK